MATNYEDTLFIVNNSQLIDTLFVNIQGTGFAFPDVIITLTPINPPIIIPPGGGSFDYTVEIVNQEDSSTTFDAWINAIKPNGMIYGPIINRCLTLGGGVSLVRMMTQNVPASAPAGEYCYNGYVGDIESTTIWDSSSFNFTKSGFFENSGDNNWELTGWEQEPLSMIETPTEFALLKPYPNPFNVDATLSFTIPKAGYVVLAVYDIQGREVTRMVDGWLQSGTYQETFSGMQLASGVYFAQLEANRFRQIQKLLLLR
jgi:hypothetical protein